MKRLLMITMCCASCLLSLAQTPSSAFPELPTSLTAISMPVLRAYVRAADSLRVASERRIVALTGELAALNTVVLKGETLTAYDEAKHNELTAQLTIAQGKLEEANRVINRCWELLPRRYRNQAGLSLYDAFMQYEADLKRRGGRLLVIGTALGGIIGFFLFR
ncbi:hypothetical protein [Fibrivirga algicola]|uniref:Uncharacterized protein n=1 Tax=Fibrivirga algicola TaxID=2950420 RepID=A0ABX0QNQ1_9BACT|nr:hypothetical protein [Fibrivirga algicola]NID13782.1 hypothetical protein [Fibrivirga algicola]